ncbi:MAG: type II secretion system F family protein [Endomicrobiia bacterium]
MPKYIYKARTSSGKIVSDKAEANTQREIIDRLKSLKYVVIEIKEFKENPLKNLIGKLNPFKNKIKSMDLTLFSRQLATLVTSGVPLVQGLVILEEQFESENFRNVLKSIRTDIESGISISEAMRKHPNAFSELYIAMVHAGEVGGILDQVLERLSVYLESSEALKSKVKGAMTYPMMILFVAVLAVTILLTFVVPQFSKMFLEMGQKLPTPTVMLIEISNFLKKWIFVIVIIVIIIASILRKMYKTKPKFTFKVDSLMLKVPVFSNVIRKTAVAKFTRTLGTLIKSGVPILQAMETVAKTSGNKVIEKAITEAKESIKEGERIAEPLKRSGVFPPMVIQMISIGEETGALDTMLTKVADFYDQEVESAITGLTNMIEPLIIVFMAAVVGSIVVAMFLPMFSLTSAISG